MISLSKISPIGYTNGSILVTDNQVKLYCYRKGIYEDWNVTSNYDKYLSNDKISSENSIIFANEEEVWHKTLAHFELFHQNPDKIRLTILMLGCTHAGKSYLLYGSSWYHKRGIVPRYVKYLYSQLLFHSSTSSYHSDNNNRLYKRQPQVQLKMYILYKEDIIDLLDPPKLYKGGKYGISNVFLSQSLGPVLIPLKTITATNVHTLLSEISTALTTASVILSNCNELISSATLITSFQVFSSTLDIMQTVEFIELAATYFDIDNNTITDIYGEIGSTPNYSRDNFSGNSYSNWSMSTLYDQFTRYSPPKPLETPVLESIEEEVKEGDEEEKNFRLDAIQSARSEDHSIDFHKSILSFVLQGSLTNTKNMKSCITIACLRGNTSCYQENSACLNLISKFETFFNASDKFKATNYNSIILSTNVSQILQNCDEEVRTINESIELEYEYIHILNEKIAKNALIYGKMKNKSKEAKNENAEEDSNKLSFKNSMKRIQFLSQRVAYLNSFIKSIEAMHKFNQGMEEEARKNLQLKDVSLLPEVSKVSSKKVKSLIEQLQMDTSTPLADDYDKPPEVIAVAKDPCPNDFLKSYGLVDRIDTRNCHTPSVSPPPFQDYDGLVPLSIDQIEACNNSIPDIPWKQNDDPFSCKDPYLLILSPNNISSVYAKVPLALGFTILKRTKLSVLETSELPKVSLESLITSSIVATTMMDENEEKEPNQLVDKTIAMIAKTLSSEDENHPYNSSIIKSSRIISSKKDTIAYKEQLNTLSLKGIIPKQLVESDIDSESQIITKSNLKASNKKGKAKHNSIAKSTVSNIDSEEGVLKDILFNIDASNVDDSSLDNLCILGVIIRKFDSISLLPTRSHIQKTSFGKKKYIRPIFKINGISVSEMDENNNIGVELYDRDIIQIGSNRWIQCRIPSTNAAYKQRPETHLMNSSDVISSLNTWEIALYLSYYEDLRNELTIQCLRKRCQITHFKVNREFNAIAKISERSNLMKLQSFVPDVSEADLFLDHLHIYDRFKIIECMNCANYATLIANEFRRNLVFSCILRPSALWNMFEDGEEMLFCSKKIQRVLKNVSYREIMLVLCYEDSNTMTPITITGNDNDDSILLNKDKEQIAFSNINCGSWLWNSDIFKSRFSFMLDMITDFTDERYGRRDLAILSIKYPAERDAFKHENLSDELVGNGFLCINRLEYLFDHDDTIRIIGYNGHPVGTIKIFIRSWIDKVESNPPYITSYAIPKLSDFMTHTLIVHFYIEYISGLPTNHCADSFISFKFLGHLSVYRTPRCAGCTTRPYIDSIIEIKKPINQSLIDYIRSCTIEFKVFACRKPASQKQTNNVPYVIRDQVEMSLRNSLVDEENVKEEQDEVTLQSMKEATEVLKSRKMSQNTKINENISLKVKEKNNNTVNKLPILPVIEKVVVKVDNNSCCRCIIQ